MSDVCMAVPSNFRFLSTAWSLVSEKVEKENEHCDGCWISMAIVGLLACLNDCIRLNIGCEMKVLYLYHRIFFPLIQKPQVLFYQTLGDYSPKISEQLCDKKRMFVKTLVVIRLEGFHDTRFANKIWKIEEE